MKTLLKKVIDELTSVWQKYNQPKSNWDHKPITDGNTAVPAEAKEHQKSTKQ